MDTTRDAIDLVTISHASVDFHGQRIGRERRARFIREGIDSAAVPDVRLRTGTARATQRAAWGLASPPRTRTPFLSPDGEPNAALPSLSRPPKVNP